MNEYVAAVDCARKHDRFSFMVSKNTPIVTEGLAGLGEPATVFSKIDVMYLDQWGYMPWRAMISKVKKHLGHRLLFGNTDLLLDGTGLGDPVVEMFVESGLAPMPLIVTQGQNAREVYRPPGPFGAADRIHGMRPIKEIHVPKVDLVAAGQLALDQRRISLARGLKWREELDAQLAHFRMQETPSGKSKYESDDLKVKDDMAFCLIMTAWWCQRRIREGILPPEQAETQQDWDPIKYM